MKAKLDTIHNRFGMHAELLTNAGAIAIGTLTASALGFCLLVGRRPQFHAGRGGPCCSCDLDDDAYWYDR